MNNESKINELVQHILADATFARYEMLRLRLILLFETGYRIGAADGKVGYFDSVKAFCDWDTIKPKPL